jgi:L-fuculose-phosphate aldolase
MAGMADPGSESSGVALQPLREGLVRAGRRLGARGLIAAGEGNLSIRLPDGRLLVTPSGLRKDELQPDDLVIVGLDGEPGGAREPREPKPTSDLAIHRAVLRARPDAGAVAHAHLPAAMALTLVGEAPDPAALPETALFLPRLPVVPFGPPGSEDLARRIAAALSEPPAPFAGAAILERHGAVAVGIADRGGAPGDGLSGSGSTTESLLRALDQAVDRLELIEVLCCAWRDAMLLRAAREGSARSHPA